MKPPGQDGSGPRTKTKSNHRHRLEMESILSLVAGWVSVKEMNALQGACVRTFTKARERQYEELLSAWDDQVWRDLSEDDQSLMNFWLNIRLHQRCCNDGCQYVQKTWMMTEQAGFKAETRLKNWKASSQSQREAN